MKKLDFCVGISSLSIKGQRKKIKSSVVIKKCPKNSVVFNYCFYFCYLIRSKCFLFLFHSPRIGSFNVSPVHSKCIIWHEASNRNGEGFVCFVWFSLCSICRLNLFVFKSTLNCKKWHSNHIVFSTFLPSFRSINVIKYV